MGFRARVHCSTHLASRVFPFVLAYCTWGASAALCSNYLSDAECTGMNDGGCSCAWSVASGSVQQSCQKTNTCSGMGITGVVEEPDTTTAAELATTTTLAAELATTTTLVAEPATTTTLGSEPASTSTTLATEPVTTEPDAGTTMLISEPCPATPPRTGSACPEALVTNPCTYQPFSCPGTEEVTYLVTANCTVTGEWKVKAATQDCGATAVTRAPGWTTVPVAAQAQPTTVPPPGDGAVSGVSCAFDAVASFSLSIALVLGRLSL